MILIPTPLLLLWEFPQNVLGLTLFIWFKLTRRIKEVRTFEFTNRVTKKAIVRKVYNISVMPGGGISLGRFIFIQFGAYGSGARGSLSINQIRVVKHEFGHTFQSTKFGILYLFAVGLTSPIANLCQLAHRKKYPGESGYLIWPESEATNLGNEWNLKEIFV